MIRALVFDFDGVILDTETPDYETWQDEFRSRGVRFELAQWTGLIGGGESFDGYRYLEELTGQTIDRAAVYRHRRKRYLRQIASGPVLPGVGEYISEAKRLGLKLAVASSSGRRWVEGHLRDRGLLEKFEAVTTRDDVSQVKPDPELYLKAVSSVGVRPEEAVAIEDSAHGVTAAKRAGLYCVVVPNPMTQDLPTDHADLRLGALSDLPLESLLSRVNGSTG